MKKISLFLVIMMLFGLIVLTSCGSSDTPDPEASSEEPVAEEPAAEEPAAEEPAEESPLVGTWYYDGNIMNATFVFNADGTGTYAFGSGEDPTVHKMTWKTEGDKLLIKYEEETEVQENIFSVDGDKLTVDTNGDVTEFDRK